METIGFHEYARLLGCSKSAWDKLVNMPIVPTVLLAAAEEYEWEILDAHRVLCEEPIWIATCVDLDDNVIYVRAWLEHEYDTMSFVPQEVDTSSDTQ